MSQFLLALDYKRKNDIMKSLQEKVESLYSQEQNNGVKNKNFQCGSRLLEKLIKQEKFNCLVINLYPGNEGYSLMLKTKTGSNAETIRLPYEESELLQYIDNEELPPLLVDLLERSQAGAFYSGNVLVEVRDHRRSSNPSTCESHHVLLKPTTQTVLSDVSMLTSDGQKWTLEERMSFEASLLIATSPPLCLDPSISVALVANSIQHRKQRLCSVPLRRLAKKHSQPALNRKRRFEHCTAPHHLKLYDFLAKRKRKICPLMNLKMSKDVVDTWRQKEIILSNPETIEVEKFATNIDKTQPINDNNPVAVEEYIMEAERGTGKVQFTHVTILQRPSDELYLGKLFIKRDGSETGCTFPLGTRANVDKYISQFMEIFTEEGRKSVKITHLVPGKAPEISHTPRAGTTPSIVS